METSSENPGARLSAWRAAVGKTLEAVAKALGLTSHTIIAEWERGTRRPGLGPAMRLEVATDGAIRIEHWGHDAELVGTMCSLLALRARVTPATETEAA